MAQPTRLTRPTGPAKPRVPNLLMRVWDLPTRLFYWAVVLLIVFSYVSVKQDWVQLHFLSGYTMLTLLLFRLVWGFAGSETSRFSQFLRSPIKGFRHLASFRDGRSPDTGIGHNAAGGWMVVGWLAILLFQVTTGLLAWDDKGPLGPLGYHLSRQAGQWAAAAHAVSFNVIVALGALHVAAILAYAVIKRQDLVRPMITGKKRLPANLRQPRFASPLLALAVVLASAGTVWLLVRFG